MLNPSAFRFLLVIAAAMLTGGVATGAEPTRDGLYADFSTPRGTITAELFFQHARLTVTNFVGLAEGTLGPAPRRPFFDGLTFHRVVPGFVVQGGDPLGTGSGGPGYRFPDDFAPGLRHNRAGMLSMANSGADTNGSQFFFTLAAVNRLNYLHSVFGRVVAGLEVLPRIQQGDKMTVKIRRIGVAAEAFRADADHFHQLIAQAVKAPVAHFDDPEGLLPTNPPRAKTFDLKLANVARATGVKIYARLFDSFIPDTPGEPLDHWVDSLAKELGLKPDSALAVHIRDANTWALWVGDALAPGLVGESGSIAELKSNGALPKAQQALLARAHAASSSAILEALKAATPDKPVPDAQKLKLNVDAVLDQLIFTLEPGSR